MLLPLSGFVDTMYSAPLSSSTGYELPAETHGMASTNEYGHPQQRDGD